MSKSTKKPAGHQQPSPRTEPSLQAEAAAAPESAWFSALLKSATPYLVGTTVYLGVAAKVLSEWKKYGGSASGKPDFDNYIHAGILALPLLFAFIFNIVPTVRRRRERRLRPSGIGANDYFDTSPRDSDPYGFFQTKIYDAFVDWAREPKCPLLHLTGLSGSGKSSLLTACLRPRLASVTRILIIRSYHDPLAALKDELLAFWKRKPDDYDSLAPLDALRRAAHQLGKDERLLVAFDQFEEFFLLRTNAPPKSNGPSDTNTPFVSEDTLTPLREFLHGFCDEPPDRLTLLLSYREDHRRLLAPLDLPARVERNNWMRWDPLESTCRHASLSIL